jgi:hypothetical protein
MTAVFTPQLLATQLGVNCSLVAGRLWQPVLLLRQGLPGGNLSI